MVERIYSRVAIAALALAGTLTISCGSSDQRGAVLDDGEVFGEARSELATVASCPAGYNIIQGTAGNDVLNGTPGSDCILGFAGDDTINGLGGNDYLFGGLGKDTIHGGDGNDVIYGEDQDDQLFGDAGSDTILGGYGNDTISGGDAADALYGEQNDDVITGDAGDDAIYGSAGDDTLSGGDGNDSVDGMDGNDTVNGGNGNDILYGHAGNDKLNGDAGSDILYGGTEDDILHGGTENDTVYGEAGNDQLFGDDGDDRLVGGAGVDTIDGGNGNDLTNEGLNGGTQFGQAGNDVLGFGGPAVGGVGTDACTNGDATCELPEPAAVCSNNSQCGAGRRCATEVNYCIFCQSDSECTGGKKCIPTQGCTTKELNCSDGIDDDGDGKIDCADPDCDTNTVACPKGAMNIDGGGQFHFCTANANGKVYCWGRDHCAELGYGAVGNMSSTPQTVPGITNALEVRGGLAHTCALRAGGTVSCWGAGNTGQRGDGIVANSPCQLIPQTVVGISGAKHLTSNGAHSCVVMGNGQIECWGDNTFGQLGNGTKTTSALPVVVSGISTAVTVEAGIQHTCAVLSDATMRCWGRNHQGQIGDNTTTDRTTPVAVGATVAQASLGQDFTCARLLGGQVYCWGRNQGRLGNGSATNSSVPVPVSGFTDAVSINAGWTHACAIRSGTNGVRCWGTNTNGELGNGLVGGTSLSPVAVNILDGSGLMLGLNASCARRTSGALWCWGSSQFGEMGQGGTANVPTPTKLAAIPAP